MGEMKMMAEAIKSLGDSGQTAFLWWIAKGIIIDVTGLISWFGFLYLVWRLVNPLVAKMIKQKWS